MKTVRAALVALALWTAGCSSPTSEEAQVRETLGELATAVEERSPSGIEQHLAEDFVGPSGMDRARARAYASVLMARYQGLGVRWTVREIAITGDRARTQLTVVLTGRALVPGFEGRGRLMDVELGWRRNKQEWQIVNAQWKNSAGT